MGIGFDDVERAVQTSNVNLPTGKLNGPKQAFTVQSTGQLRNAAAYRPIIVAWRDGVPVRLDQLGRVIDGLAFDRAVAWTNASRSVILAIQRQPGTNTVEVVDHIESLLPAFQAAIPPALDLSVIYDASQSIRASVNDVKFTLMLTVCLVVMVIGLFLRNLSATLIPGVAVPLSIIGTFAVMYLLGYSLNNLSLMALTLSVGFVVDDAIVMLENIVRYTEMGKSRREAAFLASREIGFTILSMTISLVAVFIPVVFMGGIVGRLLHEFAVTIAVAILISGVVSLTLTPMLGSRFLRYRHDGHSGLLSRGLEHGFGAMARGYELTLRHVLHHKFATVLVAFGLLSGTIYLFFTMPTGFIPSQDSGVLFGATLAGQDISYQSMARHTRALVDLIGQDPNVSDTFANASDSNSGIVFARLKPRDQRRLNADQVIAELRPKLSSVPGILVFLQNPPPITINGQNSNSVYQMTLESTDLDELYAWVPRLTQRIQGLPGLVDVNSDLQIRSPQLTVDIDRDRALSLGVTPAQIQSALAAAYGDQQISTIFTPANQYPVIIEVEPEYQQSPNALSKLYVRSSQGPLVPLESVVKVKRTVGPL